MNAQKIKVKHKSGSRERRPEIVEFQTICSKKMLDIVSQFEMAYGKLKDLWGETGGIPVEEAMAIRDDALTALREFSDSKNRFSEKVGTTYCPPKGLRKKK